MSGKGIGRVEFWLICPVRLDGRQSRHKSGFQNRDKRALPPLYAYKNKSRQVMLTHPASCLEELFMLRFHWMFVSLGVTERISGQKTLLVEAFPINECKRRSGGKYRYPVVNTHFLNALMQTASIANTTTQQSLLQCPMH